VRFSVRPTGVAERETGPAAEVALENALRKAEAAVRPGVQETLLGADTVVELDGAIYGKPEDLEAARQTLERLSGATHTVYTGIALLREETQLAAVARTDVTFRSLPAQLLERCLASGEWRGRAGAYAVQGLGAALVRRIEGDYENVVGLPVATLLDLWPELLDA
jgi:septum formation protein